MKPSDIAEETEAEHLEQRRPPEVARYYALLAALDHVATASSDERCVAAAQVALNVKHFSGQDLPFTRDWVAAQMDAIVEILGATTGDGK